MLLNILNALWAVAPTWVTEPLDTAVLLGAPLQLECSAKGYPIPTVTWYRRIGMYVGCWCFLVSI